MLLTVKSKKGSSFALQSLVGIVLSVMALVFLIPLLFEFFIQSPENLQIARDNTNSIVEFLEFSEESKYSVMNGCYFSLKLYNLENFQNLDNEPYYSYLLTSDEIFILEEELRSTGILSQDIRKEDIEREAIDKIEYPFNIDSVNVLRCTLSNNCQAYPLTERQILIPENSNQNKYELYSYFTGHFSQTTNIQTAGPGPTNLNPKETKHNNFQNYLFYSPTDKQILFPVNSFTYNYLDNNLCSYSYNFNNPKQITINSFNPQHMSADILLDSFDPNFSFKWDNEGLCFENNNQIPCADISQDIIVNEYNGFISSLFDLTGVSNLNIENIEMKTIDQIKVENIDYSFEEIFYDMRNYLLFFDIQARNIFTNIILGPYKFEPRQQYISNIFELNQRDLNKDKNYPSNRIVNLNNQIYFHVKEGEFYVLNTNLFSKYRESVGNYKIYYGNKEVNSIRKVNLNGIETYFFEIEIESKMYDVALSAQQFDQLNIIED